MALLMLMTLFIIPTVDAASMPVAVDPIPGYHNYDALTKAVTAKVGAYANLARVSSIGKSSEGRDIWMVEIGSRSESDPADRPALLIVANLEGNQLVGSELAIQVMDYLLSNYATDSAVKERLDNSTFYIIPRANPDGAELMFNAIQTGQAGNMRPMDDDNDGRVDEDGPEDLNGDGMISFMRVADSMGELMLDPTDERLLKKADPSKGESGGIKVYWEGTDNDNDGFYNEDAKGGVDVDRNFQHEYPYYTVGAGPHMVSENETRAIMDFVIAHRNIAAVLNYGRSDNLVNAPNSKGELTAAKDVDLLMFAHDSNTDARKVGVVEPPRRRFFRGGQQGSSRTGRPSTGRKPETTVNKEDQEYFKLVSEKYGEIVGLKTLPGIRKPAGSFFEYGYYQFGVPSFSTPGWAPELPAVEKNAEENAEKKDDDSTSTSDDSTATSKSGAKGKGADKDISVDVNLMKWMDASGIDGFIDWESYDHPTLGSVEIGGFKPYEYTNPPSEMIATLGQKQGAFAVEIASLFAQVRIAETKVTDHGGGVFRIEAEVENAGFLPTASAHGVESRSVKPTMVQLDIKPEALLSGAAKTSFFQALEGSGKRTSYEWIVSGKRGDKVKLKVVSQKAGKDEATITLR